MISAHTCALISQIAYHDDPARRLAAIGFRLVATYDVGGTQALIAADDDNLVLAFRGTVEAADRRTDVRFVKTDFPGGGRVHLGFFEAFERVRPAIAFDLARLSSRRRVFTGHSLGAALAVMATVEWRPDVAYVFGCPRVGNAAFVKRVLSRLFRHENWLDGVTYLPLWASPFQAWYAWNEGRRPTFYRHAGFRVRTHGFGHPIGRYVKATL